MRVWLAVVLLFTVASCSKANNIDNSTKGSLVGQQCTGADDKGCGVGAVCALGFCRSGCTTDAECAKGALCVGDRPPFGCTLPAELACSSSQPCAAPLTCGLDGKCRNGCKVSADCIRNEQTCIAGGCVSSSDPDTRWTDCVEGESACAWDVAGISCANPRGPRCSEIMVCHRGTPGWSTLGTCTSDGTFSCGVPNGANYAKCIKIPDEPIPIQLHGCINVLSVQRPNAPCTLVLPSLPGQSGTPTLSVLLGGTEFTEGFTVDNANATLQLSDSVCSRLKSGAPEIRIRICFP